MTDAAQIDRLYRQRPRDRFLRSSLLVVMVCSLLAWGILLAGQDSLWSARRWQNLKRFAGEVWPYPLRDQPFRLSKLADWAWQLWLQPGREAVQTTFAISAVAMLLAAMVAILFIFPAARNVATAHPFSDPTAAANPAAGWQSICWRALIMVSRGMLVLLRAIPEYIWAFLLLGALGPTAWPAILALAIHNAGILGRLGADVVENVPREVPTALRAQGLSRSQISLVALTPMSFSKWLLFFFYRWETCIREATVLGMLGISSLGFWVRETRARDWYDQMLAFIILGGLLVLLGDLASAAVRRIVRKA